MKKQISFEEVVRYIKKLPYPKFREVIDEYSKKTGQDFSSEINALTVSSLEKHLEQLGVNSACPKCGEKNGILKYGQRNHVQIFKCKEYGYKFSRFSGTVVGEKPLALGYLDPHASNDHQRTVHRQYCSCIRA